MITQRQLRALVHARMGRTGEEYLVARRLVLNATPPADYRLRGGVHPETAALASAFANRGLVDPHHGTALTEAMLLGVGGGLGAGYQLDEVDSRSGRIVTAGFRNEWQAPVQWLRNVCGRLGVSVAIHQTSDPLHAEEHLDTALRAGQPAVALVSAADLPYWHLPQHELGALGYAVLVYGVTGDRILVDDRNRAPLSIGHDELATARGRIPAFEHALAVPDTAACELDPETLAAAVGAGLAEHVENLSEPSESLSLPAFREWSRLVADERDIAGWPLVFNDGRGLLGALVSTYEAVTEAGLLGGNLRNLYADFLVEAAVLTGLPLRSAAAAYRRAADAWQRCAGVCASVPLVRTIVSIDAGRRAAVASGDRGAEYAAAAAEESARLRDTDDIGLKPAARASLLSDLAAALQHVHEAEVAALEALRAAVR